MLLPWEAADNSDNGEPEEQNPPEDYNPMEQEQEEEQDIMEQLNAPDKLSRYGRPCDLGRSHYCQHQARACDHPVVPCSAPILARASRRPTSPEPESQADAAEEQEFVGIDLGLMDQRPTGALWQGLLSMKCKGCCGYACCMVLVSRALPSNAGYYD